MLPFWLTITSTLRLIIRESLSFSCSVTVLASVVFHAAANYTVEADSTVLILVVDMMLLR